MSGEKRRRDHRELTGGALRRIFFALLWVVGAGLFAQTALAQSGGQMTIIAGSTAPPQSPCVPAISPTPLCNATGDNGQTNGDNGLATDATLFSPSGVAFDPKNGHVYIADGRNGVIRQIDNGGTISTIAVLPGAGAGTFATAVTVDTSGNLYYGDSNGNVFKDGVVVETFINSQIEALTTDAQGNLYELTTNQGSSYELYENGTALAGAPSTAGVNTASDKLYGLAVSCTSTSICNVYSMDPGYTGGSGSSSGVPTPTILDFVINNSGVPNLSSLTYVAQSAGTVPVYGQSLAIDSLGNFYIDEGSAIVEYTPGASGSVAVAGSGTPGYNGIGNSACTPILGGGVPITCYDLGGVPLPATSTDLNGVEGIFVTPGGVLYIADTGNNLVRRESNSTSTGCQECGPTNLSLSDQLPVISYGFAVNPVTQELYVPLPGATSSANGVVNVINASYPGTDTLIASLPVGPSPGQAVVDSVNNVIYVPNGDSTVTVISGGSSGVPPTVSATVPVAGPPTTIVVDPPLNKAYVTFFNGSAISVIHGPAGGNPASAGTPVSSIGFPAFNTLSALAVDTNTLPGGASAMRGKNLLYARCFCLGTSLVGEENYSMAIIDATTDAVISEVSEFVAASTTVSSDSMAVDETSGNVVIADGGVPSIRQWSYANQAFDNPYFPSPSFYPNHMAVDSNNEIAYFTDGYGNSASLNFTTFQEFSLSQASNVENTCGAYSNVFAVDPSTDQAYMTTCPATGLAIINGGDTQATSVLLSLIDGPTGSIITTLLLPTSGTDSANSSPSSLHGPFAIAENPSTQVVYVGNSVSNTINVVNGFPPAGRPFLNFSPNPFTFAPAQGGAQQATVTVTNDCSPPNGINLTGICGGGVAPTPLTATVVNAQGGTGTATPYSDCTFPLPVFGSCQYLVTFTPSTGNPEIFSGSILFTSDALNTPQLVNFSGTITGAGGSVAATASPTSLSFGPVPENAHASLPVTVTNTGSGGAALLISKISIVASGSVNETTDFAENDDCQFSLTGFLPGASCAITVYYVPGIVSTDTVGTTDSVSLQITTNAGLLTVPVSGTVANPNIGYAEFSSSSLDFGDIEQNEPYVTPPFQSAGQASVLTNDGGAALSVTNISVMGTNGTASTDFQESDNCPRGTTTQLAKLGTCEIYVYFAPTSPAGTLETAQILVTDSSPSGGQTIQLSGTSSTPPLGPLLLSSLPGLASLVSIDNSVPPNPAALSQGGSIAPTDTASLSSGGQFVVLAAGASNFPGPSPGFGSSFSEVFLRNTCLGQGTNCEQGTTFVAYGPASGPGANGGAACGPGAGPSGYSPFRGDKYPAIDTSGRFVAFTSDACQFAGITFTNATQIYLRDLNSGTTGLVSVDSTGSPLSLGIASNTSSNPFAMSTNPASLAFAYETTSPNVVLGVTNPSAKNEIYWTNVCTAQSPSPCTSSTLLVSQDATNPNTVANNTAEEPAISPDGRYVAFASTATDLGVTIPAGSEQVYLRDTCPTGATGCTGTVLISKDDSGNVASGDSPSVASGGRFVAFESSDTSLETGVTPSSAEQVYLRDTLNNTTTLLSQLNGKAGAGSLPFISADGRLITFTSSSSAFNSGGSTLSAIFEYDTCFNAPSPCTAGLHEIHPTTTGQVEEGALVDVVDASDQFDTFDVVNTSSGYPLTQVYVGQTTVVAPQPNSTATALALSTGDFVSFGTPVTLTATVTSNGSPVTSGSVVFSDGNGTLATVPLNSSGQAIYLVSGLVPGSYAFTANYSGATGYTTSSGSAALTVTIVQPNLSLTPSATSITEGQTLILTAVVSIPGGTVAPTGNVYFYKGTALLGSGTTTAGSSGSLTQTFLVSGLAVGGPYTFEATYLGDSNYTSSDSNSVQVTVTTASAPPPPANVKDMETITVTDAPTFPDAAVSDPITVTDKVKVVACGTIMISPSGTLPGATVGSAYMQQFSAVGGTSPLAWAIGNSPPTWLSMNSGTGALSGTPPTGSAGAYPFAVTVTDANGCPGSANVSLTVVSVPPIATTTTIMATASSYMGLALPANFALVGNPVTVNFKVAPASGSATATGTTKVADGVSPSTDNCSIALAAGAGSCALTISQLGTGSTPLTAAYSPDSTASALGLQASTSTPVTEDVVEITSCGTLPSVQTSGQGTAITFTFSTCLATDVLAAPNAVVTGCPPNATCTASTAPVPGKLGVYSVVVTIVPGGAGRGAPLDDRRPWGEPLPLTLLGFGLLLATLTALQLARQNRARPRLAYAAGIVIALTLLLSGLHGCASHAVSNTLDVRTPPGTYVIHVTIAAGNFSVVVPVTLDVTN